MGIEPDVVFDLDLTRNRPDCWSIEGVARDLAAWRSQSLSEVGEGSAVSGETRTVPVSIADPACGRFTATVISGVRVGPSPEWMARRLEALGMRAINNVVDVSNYVMLELGQPNHAYDLSTIGGGFSVRMARDGETLTTLDDVERSCTFDDLLICDGNDVPVGLGGVMGGADSEISDSTTEVVLEIAWFAPLGIMKTASRHGLRSEASARYERGVDPALADRAVQRFAELLSLSCPDLVVHAGGADERSSGMPELVRSAGVRISEVNRILGTDLVAADLPGLLDPIGFTVTANGDDVAVALPSWRPDSTSEIDVIEEIARHHGYGRLGRSVPKPTGHGHLTQAQIRRRLLRDVLVGLGISE
ncbi:MAG: phenylalanine--tRNA ligase subunit beta, partial [Ilumatobacteraceae bacterium]